MLKQATLAFASILLFVCQSQALLEVRGALTLLNANPSELQDFTVEQFTSSPKVNRMTGYSLDAIAAFPAMPVGVGVRVETFKGNDSGVGTETEIEWKRYSILINKRFVDRGVYLGPIVTFGVSNDLRYRTGPIGSTQEFKARDPLSASVGIEAGISLFVLKIGGEFGYLYAPVGQLKNAETLEDVQLNSGKKVEADMSGTYARATIGLHF